jgi:hypothetical protein
MLSVESFKACLEAQAGQRDVGGLGNINQAGLQAIAV